jgi:phosphoribosylanthranilate isomerase
VSVLVKVCGMTLPGQVQALDALGVDFLGFIFAGKSPRKVTPEHVAAIPRGRAKRVGVFVEQSAGEVKRIMDAAGLDYAQLHAGQDEDFCCAVGVDRVIKVFWPERHEPVAALEKEMARFASLCAMMLLDAGTSGGGHGASLHFAPLGGLASPKPWLLAGGLSPDNAGKALREAKAAGLDLNSGVELSPGVKDISRVRQVLHLTNRF